MSDSVIVKQSSVVSIPGPPLTPKTKRFCPDDIGRTADDRNKVTDDVS